MLRSLIASSPAIVAVRAAALSVVALLSVGCETKSFLDPAQVGRWEKDPLVVPILDSLNLGTDEMDAQFVGARDVEAADLVDSDEDYLVSPNDMVQVTIPDLQGQGTETTKTVRVSSSGKISLPSLPQPVTATGLTEQQLERSISDAYKDADVIRNPNISASVVEARGRTYNMYGAIGAPGPYAIFDADFRLLNALATAHDVTGVEGVDYIYIVRKKSGAKSATGSTTTTTGPATMPATGPGVDPLAPRSDASVPGARRSQMLQTAGQAPAGSIIVVDGKEMVVTPPTAATTPSAGSPTVTEAESAAAMPMTAPSTPFTFNAPKEPTDREVIRVPYPALRAGQLKYNVIVRPGDLIYVAPPVSGEYYIGGNVLAPGAYSLTARKITLKEALTAARGLNEVAWPSRTDIIRRLPGDKEIFVRVDLDKIESGQEPDIYLKPYDHVNVGTNALAPFLGAIRNGFRLTYGFGFLYDKNFSDDNNNR